MLEPADKLWRYMKLSSFLLLLEGKAWIPSIAGLQLTDPLEARLGTDFHVKIWDELERQGYAESTGKWLRESLPGCERKMPGLDLGNYRSESNFLVNAYARHMSHRRVAWCWFKSNLESSAMWSIYGNRGIAIQTSLEQLDKSFPKDKGRVIEEMIYVDRRPCSRDSMKSIAAKNPKALLRPYFLKAVEYKHESEVRLVAHCPEGHDGILVKIKARNLINEVLISPLLPVSESETLKKFLIDKYPYLEGMIKQSDLNGKYELDMIDRFTEVMYNTNDEHINLAELPVPLREL
jgi:hypothetical protein